MTLTCPYCKRKFHKGKTSEFKRLSKHIWKEHKTQHVKKIKSGKRKKKVTQLDEELMLTDDLYLATILEIDERLQRLEGTPTIHRDAVGLVIDYAKEVWKHRDEKPKKPLRKALTGYAYRGGYKKR